MKKFITLLLVMMLVLTSFAARGSTEEGGSAASGSVEGTPAEIIDTIYEQHPVADLPLGTIEVDLADPDAVMMFTGLSSADKIAAAAASESMMGAQAYSLVVVRLNDAADAETVANEMLNGINTRKWICVEANDLLVATSNDVALLIMVDSNNGLTAQSFVDAFNTVVAG